MEMSSPRAKATYRNVRLFVIFVLAVTFCYPALIDTAVVRPEKQLQRSRVLPRDSNVRNVRIGRAAEDSDEEDARRRICNAPCGWAVYNPFTRNIEYFMRNTCECPDESYKCVRVGEDLSASAYVYRCRQNTTEDDIESPDDTN